MREKRERKIEKKGGDGESAQPFPSLMWKKGDERKGNAPSEPQGQWSLGPKERGGMKKKVEHFHGG